MRSFSYAPDVGRGMQVIPMNAAGAPDMGMLEAMLVQHAASSLIVGTFTLACPVTGAVADYRRLTRLLHKHGAVAVFEYSGAGASLPLACTTSSGSGLRSPCAAEQPDAVVMSPSSLPGGAGAAAVLVIRRSVIQVAVPQGRETSSADSFESFSGRLMDTFIADIEHHEGADPANLLGVVRAGLAVQLHSDMVPPIMHSITEEYTRRAITAWRAIPGVQLLGSDQLGPRLPVVSFNLLVQRFPLMSAGRHGQPAVGMPVLLHHRFVANALSDVYGIQVCGPPRSRCCGMSTSLVSGSPTKGQRARPCEAVSGASADRGGDAGGCGVRQRVAGRHWVRARRAAVGGGDPGGCVWQPSRGARGGCGQGHGLGTPGVGAGALQPPDVQPGGGLCHPRRRRGRP